MNIIRDSFLAGLIGKEFQFQPETPEYANALVQADNVLIDPYGQVTRRPPLVSIGTLSSITFEDIIYYPADARAIDFVFSTTERYIAIFVTYSADGEDDISYIVVQDTAGTQKASLSAPYSQLEILELDTHQSNDTMWISHQNHKPQELVRVEDEDWTLDEQETSGGPFLDENEDSDKLMNVGLSTWRDDFTYEPGDIILPPSTTTGTVSWIGTAFSMANDADIIADNPVSGIYGAIATWETNNDTIQKLYINSDDFCTRNSKGGDTFRTWYPYTYIQVDKVFSGALSVSDPISMLVDFVESGGQDTYSQAGTIEEILTGTTYDYLKVDFAWRGKYWNPSTNHPLQNALGNNYEMPLPEIPSSELTYWENWAQQSGKFVDGPEDLLGEQLLRGSDSKGGASITATPGNIAQSDTAAKVYRALTTNLDKEPVASTDDWEEVDPIPDESPLVIISGSGVSEFNSNDLDRQMYVDRGEDYALSDVFTATDESEGFYAIGRVQLTTTGEWSGQMALETSNNEGVTWEKQDSLYSVSNLHNGVIEIYIEERDVLVRVRSFDFSGSCAWSVEYPEGYSNIYNIVGYLTANTVLARILTGDAKFFQSSRWAMGAWGGDNGYPATVTIHENRLWYSGSIGEPFKHWGSAVGTYWNFAIGTLATAAIIFQARADSSSQITWTEVKGESLFFGTDYGEYSGTNLDPATTLSATNPPKTERHTAFGSARIPAVLVGSDLAYISADKKKCRFLSYDGLERDGYRSYDMTHRAPRVAGSGFIGHVLQRTPYPVLWLWTADGNAVSFTVDRELGRLAFAQHSTANGLIKSLCVIPDENGIDEIYAVVEREDTVTYASGTPSPDVAGTYSSRDVLGAPSVAICGAGTSDVNVIVPLVNVSDGYEYYAVSLGGASTLYLNHEDNFQEMGERWVISYGNLAQAWAYLNESTATEVEQTHEYDWVSHEGDDPPPVLYQVIVARSDDAYIVATRMGELFGNYYIIEVATNTLLFESSTLYGTYTAVAGSGATGAADVGALNFHIEKLDYTETEYTDNLGGAVEEEITSEWEPTPLSRGPKFLDGNIRFRSSRVIFYVTESNGGEVSIDGGDTWTSLDYSKLTADENGLYTGFVEVRKQSGWEDYISPKVRTTGTDPLNISAIKMPIEKGDRGGA